MFWSTCGRVCMHSMFCAIQKSSMFFYSMFLPPSCVLVGTWRGAKKKREVGLAMRQTDRGEEKQRVFGRNGREGSHKKASQTHAGWTHTHRWATGVAKQTSNKKKWCTFFLQNNFNKYWRKSLIEKETTSLLATWIFDLLVVGWSLRCYARSSGRRGWDRRGRGGGRGGVERGGEGRGVGRGGGGVGKGGERGGGGRRGGVRRGGRERKAGEKGGRGGEMSKRRRRSMFCLLYVCGEMFLQDLLEEGWAHLWLVVPVLHGGVWEFLSLSLSLSSLPNIQPGGQSCSLAVPKESFF